MVSFRNSLKSFPFQPPLVARLLSPAATEFFDFSVNGGLLACSVKINVTSCTCHPPSRTRPKHCFLKLKYHLRSWSVPAYKYNTYKQTDKSFVFALWTTHTTRLTASLANGVRNAGTQPQPLSPPSTSYPTCLLYIFSPFVFSPLFSSFLRTPTNLSTQTHILPLQCLLTTRKGLAKPVLVVAANNMVCVFHLFLSFTFFNKHEK